MNIVKREVTMNKRLNRACVTVKVKIKETLKNG